MFKAISKLILSAMGWKAANPFPSNVKKYVVIVGPHTSSWDFIIGVLFRSALKIEVRFLGKEELFKGPFGFIFRWLGGFPVDRFHHSNMVDSVVRIFDSKEEFGIALSPEGTRKRVEKLRTGFYYIALKARVPVIMAGLDYKKKCAIFSAPIDLTGNQEADFQKIYAFFRNITGKIPEYGMQHF
jgi:1-acyl-sn-glycerol-3-phosphate acyltransferase